MQDFEALTPNLLARTMETVEGGGIVVLLLSTLRSLTQLFTLTMDVHARLRTESHQEVRGARRAEEPFFMDCKLVVVNISEPFIIREPSCNQEVKVWAP